MKRPIYLTIDGGLRWWWWNSDVLILCLSRKTPKPKKIGRKYDKKNLAIEIALLMEKGPAFLCWCSDDQQDRSLSSHTKKHTILSNLALFPMKLRVVVIWWGEHRDDHKKKWVKLASKSAWCVEVVQSLLLCCSQGHNKALLVVASSKMVNDWKMRERV